MTIMFENAAVFDGETPKLRERMSVVVEGNVIKTVTQDKLPRPANATVIDCGGKTLMPGMIDNHVHIYCESVNFVPPGPPLSYRAMYAHKFLTHLLSCGFTTVRDVAGGDHGVAMALRDGLLEGPRFYYGGLSLSQTGGHGDFRTSLQGDYFTCGVEHNTFAVIADGVDACIKAAREELRKGAKHIKIFGSGGVMSTTDPLERCQYSDAEIRAIIDESTRHGAYVCAHCHPTNAIRRCAELGVRSIEHGTLIDAPTAAFVAEKGVFVVPTMSVMFALTEDGPKDIPPIAYEKLRRVMEAGVNGLAIMKREGTKMGFGTDLLGHQHVRQGTEFTLRKQVLGAFDILHSATAVNADILQMKDRLGVVKPGALADLLVVDGDPLANIELLAAAAGKHLTHIMIDGRLVKQPAPSAKQ
jgi:imidazolonepropionase-like amidohydrolase